MATTPEIRLDPPEDLDEARGLRALKFVATPPPGAVTGTLSDPVVGEPAEPVDAGLALFRAIRCWLSGPPGDVLVVAPGSGLVAVDPATGKAVWWLGNAGAHGEGGADG
jgi:hypothetical protein